MGAVLVSSVTVGVAAWRSAPGVYQETDFLLDTYVRFQVAGPQAEEAVREAKDAMAQVEHLLNRYDPSSEIACINQGQGTWVPVSPLTKEALRQARSWGQRSRGAFDVALGQVLDLYEFGQGGSVPGEHELATALQGAGLGAWELDAVASRARTLRSETVLDLGGLHKGLAVDQAASVLRERGVAHALVDASGNMQAIGARPDGGPWRIGIENPRQPGRLIAVVPLADRAISTSGDYQQYFERDGVRYHHLLDPRTGKPARSVASVTVLAPTAMEADILSTALFVLGPEAGLRLLKGYPDVDALFVTPDLRLIMTPGLRAVAEVQP